MYKVKQMFKQLRSTDGIFIGVVSKTEITTRRSKILNFMIYVLNLFEQL
jgi:hypothetical protein